MELNIHNISNHHETLYIDHLKIVEKLPTYTEIQFTILNQGEIAEITMKVPEGKVKRYNSIPDYEATAWEFLRGVLKGLGE